MHNSLTLEAYIVAALCKKRKSFLRYLRLFAYESKNMVHSINNVRMGKCLVSCSSENIDQIHRFAHKKRRKEEDLHGWVTIFILNIYVFLVEIAISSLLPCTVFSVLWALALKAFLMVFSLCNGVCACHLSASAIFPRIVSCSLRDALMVWFAGRLFQVMTS